jgi:hypothetical protein
MLTILGGIPNKERDNISGTRDGFFSHRTQFIIYNHELIFSYDYGIENDSRIHTVITSYTEELEQK